MRQMTNYDWINLDKIRNILTVLILLSLSTITPGIVFAAPLKTSATDWQYTNGNSWAWNYSPQNQINKDNVNQLEVKWIFPLEPKSAAPISMQLGSGSLGSRRHSCLPKWDYLFLRLKRRSSSSSWWHRPCRFLQSEGLWFLRWWRRAAYWREQPI